MEAITAAVIAWAIGEGLLQVGRKLLEKGVVDPGLEPAIRGIKGLVRRPFQKAAEDRVLLSAVQDALADTDAPVEDGDALDRWLKGVSLDRLVAKSNTALRRQFAQAMLGFTDPRAEPPEDLVRALGWPRSQRQRLSVLLAALRSHLYRLEDWRAPIAYADEAAQRGLLAGVLAHLSRLDNVFVATEKGEALRVAVVQQGVSAEEAAEIEGRYRADMVSDQTWCEFRGIAQVKKDIRLPLADIYLELGLLGLSSEEERRRAHERLLALREAERMAEEERRLQERVTDALARSQRLVILGEPGAGKTISLRFIALMLAHGHGAARLGLEAPYLPLMMRLGDYADELEKTPALGLDNFLLQVVGQAYASHSRLSDFLRLALDRGACMVLLDGLDEIGADPVRGQSLRTRVVQRVQQFADRWCGPDRSNRLVVTSRIEGYWDESLRAFDHVQLSPLSPPDEVREFLVRWYTAHEQFYDKTLPPEAAERRAEERVSQLLPRILDAPSARRLATNPLLLTILALIHENVGKLPNRRAELYRVCAQTLIESWRQLQTGLPPSMVAELGGEKVMRIMAPLAYWLHEEQPGGTASFQEWRARLQSILSDEGFEAEAEALADRFLQYARTEAGLLSERGVGRYGFFHPTFEEYLAAWYLARQRPERRRDLLRAHWEDAHWQEVILLAAGQLGIVDANRDDAGDFIEDLLKMEPSDVANEGRQAVLAGRALADIGVLSVTGQTLRWVMEALRRTMQDLDADTGRPSLRPRLSVRTRYAAGEALDELGWLPEDLDAWVLCSGCADDGGDLLAMKYPVTNVQFERFVQAGGYENPAYWGGVEGEGWLWRVSGHPGYRGGGPVVQPEYWQHPRFGKDRRGYPAVGVSWYEAKAYADWLAERLQAEGGRMPVWRNGQLETLNLAPGTLTVRLPTETEWVKLAGGLADENRYPWDPPRGSATGDEAAIMGRANTSESGINGTSPVAMHPLGASRPFGLMDLAGNVWEWTGSWYDEKQGARVLLGGSWSDGSGGARPAVRRRGGPQVSLDFVGLRLVSPIGSGF